MEFLKKDGISLINGGYLVKTDGEKPVYHAEYVKIQQEAHYLVTLAANVKGNDFVQKKVKSFDSIVLETKNQLNNEAREYVAKPKVMGTPLIDGLQKEALAWITNQGAGNKAEKLNKMMQKYNALAEFEEFGLYFSTDTIIKLKKLYTVKDITDAITILEPHLA